MIVTQQVEDYLKQMKFRSEDIVYCSGSIIEGIGNDYSDLDFYIICDEIPDGISNQNVNVDLISVNNNIIDVEYLYKKNIQNIFNKLKDITKENAVGILSTKEKRIIHRFINSKVYNNNNDYIYLESIMNKRNLFMTCIQDLEIKYRDIRIDLLGNISSNNLQTSYINLLDLISVSMELTIISKGETISNPKWRYEKLKQIDYSLAEEYWLMKTRTINNLDDIKLIHKKLNGYHETLFKKIIDYLPEWRKSPYDGFRL